MAVLASVVVSALCGAMSVGVASARLPAFDSGLADVVGGRLASHAGHVETFVLGRTRAGTMELRAFRAEARRWRRVPGPFARVDDSAPFHVARLGRALCLYASVGGKLGLSCRRGGRWVRSRPLLGDGYPVGLFRREGELIVAARSAGSLRTYALRRAGRLVEIADALPVGRGLLGMSQSGRPLVAARSTAPPGTITIYGLAGSRWQAVGPVLDGVGIGPLIGGPIARGGGGVALAVTRAQAGRWPLRIATLRSQRWSVSSALNTSGKAQGLLSGVNGGTAIWQQHAGLSRGTFRTRVYVAPVRPDGSTGSARRLLAARTIGPGPLDVVSSDGHVVVLYPGPAREPRTGLTVHIRQLD